VREDLQSGAYLQALGMRQWLSLDLDGEEPSGIMTLQLMSGSKPPISKDVAKAHATQYCSVVTCAWSAGLVFEARSLERFVLSREPEYVRALA
jgi:hypothetical protein